MKTVCRACEDHMFSWQDAVWQRLWHALEMAFGGFPPGIAAQPLIAQGSAGPVLVSVAGRGLSQAPEARSDVRCRRPGA
jgi:hypothetical protein